MRSKRPPTRQREKECRTWLAGIKAAAGGLLTKLDPVYVAGEAGISVNPAVWYRQSFEVKLELVKSYVCLARNGEPGYFPINVYDSQSHRTLGYFNGRELSVK